MIPEHELWFELKLEQLRDTLSWYVDHHPLLLLFLICVAYWQLGQFAAKMGKATYIWLFKSNSPDN